METALLRSVSVEGNREMGWGLKKCAGQREDFFFFIVDTGVFSGWRK